MSVPASALLSAAVAWRTPALKTALRVVDDCVEVHALDISGLEDLRSDRLPARVRLFDRAPELEAMPEPNPRPDAAAQSGQAGSADGQPRSADGQPAAADRRPGDHDA